MTSRLGTRFVRTSMLAAATLSAVANAQERSVSPELETIIVTATKREQSLAEVGASVTALSGKDLQMQRISTGADLALSTPGLDYTPTQTGTPVYTLRGVGFYEGSLAAYPDVSLYIDQVPLSLPAMTSKTIFDLERVEVLKGPQGTLFGNNATAGAINLVPAKPTRELSAASEVSYGRFNTADISGFVSGPLSDNLSVRVAVKAVNGDEWQKSHTRNDKLGQRDSIASRFLMDWEATDRLKFSLNINGWRDRDDPQATQVFRRDIKNPAGSIGFGGVVPSDLPVLSTPIAPEGANRGADWSEDYRPFSDSKFWQSALRVDYELADEITLTSLSGYADLDFHSSTDEDGSALVIFGYPDNRGDIESFTQELRVSNGSGSSLRWVIGANYERTQADQISDHPSYESSSASVNGFGVLETEALQWMRNRAGFGNVEFDITDRVTLKGGIRQSRAERKSGNSLYSVADIGYAGVPYTGAEFFNLVFGAIYQGVVPPIEEGGVISLDTRTNPDGTPVDPSTFLQTGTYTGRLSENSTSWSIGVDVKPVDGLLLYGNISQGYKSGSFPFLAAALFEGYEPVTQESLLSYELGAKVELLDRRLMVNGAAFYYDYRDKQLRTKYVDPIFGSLDRLRNVPESEVFGAEIEIIARPRRGPSFSASIVYLDAEVKSYIGTIGESVLSSGLREPITTSFKGISLPFAAELQYSFRTDYEFAAFAEWNVFLGASINGQSKSFSSLAATAQARSDYLIKSYGIVDATAGFSSKDGRWRVAAWGKNIFDKFYITNRFEGYDTYVQTTGRPIEYGVSVSYRY